MSRSIPADEMLLAKAIAAAKARGLSHVIGQRFWPAMTTKPIACCAEGALELAGIIPKIGHPPDHLANVWIGNDDASTWEHGKDEGESLGWAFRCAMEDES